MIYSEVSYKCSICLGCNEDDALRGSGDATEVSRPVGASTSTALLAPLRTAVCSSSDRAANTARVDDVRPTRH